MTTNKKTNNVKTVRTIVQLLKIASDCTSQEELYLKIYKEMRPAPSYLLICINSPYVKEMLNEEEFKKVNEIVLEYVKSIDNIKIIQEEAKYKEKLNKIKNIVLDFTLSNYDNSDDYCKEINIAPRTFSSYLLFIKQNDEETYDKYLYYQEKINRDKFTRVYTGWKTVINGLKNGVIENGKVREFDIVDYYDAVKVNIDELVKILKNSGNIDYEDIITLKLFASKNKLGKKLSDKAIEQIYQMEEEINLKKDSNGYLIPNTGRIITKEEKELVINYLIDNKIPLYSGIYAIALKKYLDNTLKIESNKSKKL